MRLYIPRAQACSLVSGREPAFGQFEAAAQALGAVVVDNAEAADAIVLFERWQTRFETHVAELEAEPLVRNFWQKLVTINFDDTGRGFLPGLYTSLTPALFDPALHRACIYPHYYNELVDLVPLSRIVAGAPSSGPLYSFRGTDGSHPVRARMVEACAGDPQAAITVVRQTFHTHEREQKQRYIEEMLESRFVLCPRGHSPASFRLFEAMQLGRAPVVISDDWIRIAGVPWESFAIFVAERDVAAIGGILRARAGEAAARGQAARRAYEQFFAPERRFTIMYETIRELLSHGPWPDYRARWRSSSFRRANGWLLSQKLGRRLRRLWTSAQAQASAAGPG